MTLPHLTRPYEQWAPVVARVLFGALFLYSAFYKIPGTETFAGQVEMSAAVGIPFAMIAVTLAFIVEVGAGIALIVGYNSRTAAAVLIVFTALIAVFFGRDLSDQMQMMTFFSCLQIIAGLLYVSVYGAQKAAVGTCPLPHGLSKTSV
ncbi:DoxX family protein [Patescibacteria group bacterium]|nr:DoxX family protein [Patescibacteria group bacterium]